MKKPVRKFELHLDAVIVIVAVFLLASGFIVYQRHQYTQLLDEWIAVSTDHTNLKVDFEMSSRALEKCMDGAESANSPGEAEATPAL